MKLQFLFTSSSVIHLVLLWLPERTISFLVSPPVISCNDEIQTRHQISSLKLFAVQSAVFFIDKSQSCNFTITALPSLHLSSYAHSQPTNQHEIIFFTSEKVTILPLIVIRSGGSPSLYLLWDLRRDRSDLFLLILMESLGFSRLIQKNLKKVINNDYCTIYNMSSEWV